MNRSGRNAIVARMQARRERRARAFEVLPFDSLSEFVDAAKEVPERWHNADHETRYQYHEVLHFAVKGNASLVPKAEALLNEIADATGEVPTRQWAPSPHGAYPVVPEFLAGIPVCMRKMEHLDDESSPITVWLDMTSSGGVPNEVLEKRGIALLALVMKLQSIRPIELNLCIGAKTNNAGVSIRINTHPLDLATACFVMCHAEFARLPMYAVVRNHTNDLLGMIIEDREEFRAYFGADPQDLIISCAYLDDMGQIDRDPVGWVNAQLARYGTREAV